MGNPQKIVIVGAGPVGSLAALYAAQRGHQVEVYELRPGKTNLEACQSSSAFPLHFQLFIRSIEGTHPCWFAFALFRSFCSETLNHYS